MRRRSRRDGARASSRVKIMRNEERGVVVLLMQELLSKMFKKMKNNVTDNKNHFDGLCHFGSQRILNFL